MNRLFYFLLLMIICSKISIAKSQQDYIVLTTSKSNSIIGRALDRYNKLFDKDKVLIDLKTKKNFQAKTMKKNGLYQLRIGPFSDSDALTLVYLKTKASFRAAFIEENTKHKEVTSLKPKSPKIKSPKKDASSIEIPPKDTSHKKNTSPKIKYIDRKIFVEKEDPILWTALFGLAMIGIFALFLSSDQIKNLKSRHIKIQKRQNETEKRQNLLLAKMGEKIHNAVLKNIESESKILKESSEESVMLKSEISNIKKYDDDLLKTTYEMIDFLKIKSGSIVIHREPFQLSNMLHKLTNSIYDPLKNNNSLLYYNIKTNIPRYLLGDSLRIFQVLHNILLSSIEDKDRKNNKIILSLGLDKQSELIFKITNNSQFFSQEEIDLLFLPSSWEDLQKTNKELGFFVTKELVSQMDGTFLIESNIKSGTTYELRLPYIKDKKEKSYKKQLKEILAEKKVLIIDNDLLNIRTIQYILESYGIKAKEESTADFEQHKPQKTDWDIIILNLKSITPVHVEFIKDLRQKNDLKVILMHKVLESGDLDDIALQIIDAKIYSPIIPGDIEEVLFQIFIAKQNKKTSKNEIRSTSQKQQTKTIKILENLPSRRREDFRKFAGHNILIVEDNFVNQKVMSSILSSSDINIYKSENGLMALEVLEKNDIDLILMDMSMPVMDGFMTTRKIKKEPRLKHIPVIAVTGLGFNHEIERMDEAGVDACIVKPFKIGQLYEAMNRYLAQNTKDEIKTKAQHVSSDYYTPNKNILNVEQGIINAQDEIFYKEMLTDVKELLEKSDNYFISMISEDKLKELRTYCHDTLSLVDTIGAVQLTKIFKEISIFLRTNSGVSLGEYIPLYRKEWRKLKKEMEMYLNS